MQILKLQKPQCTQACSILTKHSSFITSSFDIQTSFGAQISFQNCGKYWDQLQIIPAFSVSEAKIKAWFLVLFQVYAFDSCIHSLMLPQQIKARLKLALCTVQPLAKAQMQLYYKISWLSKKFRCTTFCQAQHLQQLVFTLKKDLPSLILNKTNFFPH